MVPYVQEQYYSVCSCASLIHTKIVSYDLGSSPDSTMSGCLDGQILFDTVHFNPCLNGYLSETKVSLIVIRADGSEGH